MFGGNEIALYFAIGASALAVIFLVWAIRLEIKLGKILFGSGAKNLDDSISNIKKEISALHTFRYDSTEYLKDVENRLRTSIRGVEIARFNPFKGTGDGGNQSFSTVLINEEGDGLVLSSLYSRDRVSLFGKPLKKFVSEHELSDEEKEVLARSQEKVKSFARK